MLDYFLNEEAGTLVVLQSELRGGNAFGIGLVARIHAAHAL